VEPTSRRLTIFEGPDGSGKTTAAKRYADFTGARYVHFSALPRVNTGLARMYVEAMLPAVLGYQDVVFDRSWLSEMPYGMAFREGRDRLNSAQRRMLERLALRCGAVVVACDPGWERIEASFIARRGQEMLKSVGQLREVYDLYSSQNTDLPSVTLNYTVADIDRIKPVEDIESARTPLHPLRLASAGNWSGKYILVGDSFAERKDQDVFYQWPFASFSNEGCSQWLANQLEKVEVTEQDLFWVNADQDLSLLPRLLGAKVIALGGVASKALAAAGLEHCMVSHPQWWKRFSSNSQYELIRAL
jgi:hypothetical protein